MTVPKDNNNYPVVDNRFDLSATKVLTFAGGSVMGDGKIITGGKDIILDTKTANVTSGVIRFICFYHPLSDDGSVVAA